MTQPGLSKGITFSQRYECKYLVSPMLASSLRQFIQPFMRPDPFAAQCEGFRYPLSSLYLDSDDLKLYQQTVSGEKNRFKLRVRTYSSDPVEPAYLEVKRKVNNIVSKTRARVTWDVADRIVHRGVAGSLEDVAPREQHHAERFSNYMGLVGAKPLIRVRYWREAYESAGGDPVRVTLDTDLMHATTLDRRFDGVEGRWNTTPVDGVIVEVKFTERFPTWVSEMIRTHGLKQRPVPKYVMSVEHVLSQGREASLALAGFTMPPRRA